MSDSQPAPSDPADLIPAADWDVIGRMHKNLSPLREAIREMVRHAVYTDRLNRTTEGPNPFEDLDALGVAASDAYDAQLQVSEALNEALGALVDATIARVAQVRTQTEKEDSP